MEVYKILLLLLIVSEISVGQRTREQRNLRGVFPFSQQRTHAQSRHQEHHGHHEANRISHADTSARDSRQRGGGGGRDGDEVDLSIGSIAKAGERCIDKVVMVEETEYDDVVTCKHSYSQKCHTTYTTDFQPQQEEECEENFVKNCFIEYKKVASDEVITFCHTPILLKGGGPEVCKKVYESQCRTIYHEHEVKDDVVECETIQEEKCEDVTQGYTTEEKCTKWPVQKCDTKGTPVKKYSPQTDCQKVPVEVCGSGNIQEAGAEECFDKKETVVQEVPEETCNLEPQKECNFVTKLVPLLKPVENCIDIPKEVCSRSRTNPRKIQKPVVKKWCYVPSAQSGLA